MPIDEEAAYRAVRSRDARFDGMFYTGVRTTGIYCRPSCPARTPHRRNVGFYPSSAAAQRAGFRACKMCRPDATPGSADWNSRDDLAGRAVRLIADGVVDRDGVTGLARELGYSERQLSRALVATLGAPPLALARAQRAQTARILLESTDLPAAEIAFAAGFASIRQFNDTIREVFASTPSQLRAATRTSPGGEPGTIDLRLAYRPPMDLATTLRYLAGRAVTGLEGYDGATFTRTLRLPHGAGLVRLAPAAGFVAARLRLADHRDLTAAVARVRRLLDLDADPQAVDEVLAAQRPLAGLVARRPGLRSPGAVDGFEMAVRAVVGQQVSVAGARTVLGRLVAHYGRPAFEGDPGWRLFPEPATIAALDPATLPMPRARGRSLVTLAAAVATGDLVLSPGCERAETRAALLRMPGIGPWTADYLLMRAAGDPDVYLGTDLGIRQALAGLAGGGELDPGATSPWRSYLTHHLWATLAVPTPVRKPAPTPEPDPEPTPRPDKDDR